MLLNNHSKIYFKNYFLKENKKLKLIKYNLFLINKLDLSINDYKISLFKKIIDNYDCNYIKNYYLNCLISFYVNPILENIIMFIMLI